jgi:hypothetical protein
VAHGGQSQINFEPKTINIFKKMNVLEGYKKDNNQIQQKY